jgi:colanic acid/amylovoran biosynthesis glycosyltransferase
LIIFKVPSFPEVSETFILSAIISAIKSGEEVKIIANKVKAVANSSQPELLFEYDLLKKSIEFQQPTDKKLRKRAFLAFLFKPVSLYYYFKFCLIKGKVSLDYVFYLNFYASLRKTAVFHAHFLPSLTPLLELKKIGYLKSKLIVTFHGYDAHFLPQRAVLDNMLLNIEKYVNHITVNSQYLKNLLVNKGFKSCSIDIVPIGIDTVFFKNINQRDFENKRAVKLITVGRLVPLKGQEYGISAVKLLKDLGYHVSYTLIGSGSELSRLKELVRKLELQNSVCFLGDKSQEEIKNELEQHDVFLMTSTHDDHGRREAFGVVSLEAQAMGLPVIGFDSGGFPETIINKHTGFIVPDRDVNGIAIQVIELADNTFRLNQMSLNAADHIRKNFDINLTKYDSFY